MAEHCKEQNGSSTCLPCDEDGYIEYPNRFDKCLRCWTCREGRSWCAGGRCRSRAWLWLSTELSARRAQPRHRAAGAAGAGCIPSWCGGSCQPCGSVRGSIPSVQSWDARTMRIWARGSARRLLAGLLKRCFGSWARRGVGWGWVKQCLVFHSGLPRVCACFAGLGNGAESPSSRVELVGFSPTDQVELSPCSATRNTQCACRNGTFCSPDHPCEMCQKCRSR